VDHAEPADEADARFRHGGAEHLPGQLPHRLDEPQVTASGSRLADRQLATRGVEREVAVGAELMPADELGTLALCTEAEVLDLHQRDYRVVVVRLQEVDVARTDAGLGVEFVAIERPAATHLDRIVRIRVVALDGSEDPRIWEPEFPRTLDRKDEETLGARAGHHTVEEAQRLGNWSRFQVFGHRERLAQERVRKGLGVAPLR